MKLATLRVPKNRDDADTTAQQTNSTAHTPSATQRTIAAALIGDDFLELPRFSDLGQFLAADEDQQRQALAIAAAEAEKAADAATLFRCGVDEANFAPLIPQPSKIICVGLNYTDHIAETGNPTPEYPTLFAKFPDTLAGAHDPVAIHAADHRLDWEVELAVIIGGTGRNWDREAAAAAIAGYSVAQDFSYRGYQGRTQEWLQGKIMDASTPLGPYLVPVAEVAEDAEIFTEVNGERVQQSTLAEQVFSPAELVSYISALTTLRPGDVIITGTPAGVALGRRNEAGRHPWLQVGDHVVAGIEGIGQLRTLITEPRS